jgi:putative transposase
VTSQHRSSQRYRRRKVPDELLLRERLRLLARRHPRYGYRRIHVLLCREGWACNRKRVQRLWRDEGLRLPAKARRRRRGKRMPGHVAAACPNHVWALDFLVDQTADGRPIKILTVTDEYTREALATPAARRMGADDTVSVLERIVERRGQAPQLTRCDNGRELVAHALRDWCRFTGVTTGYIEPGAPWQNPYIESFNGHLRRELLDMESFNSLYEAQLLLDDSQAGGWRRSCRREISEETDAVAEREHQTRGHRSHFPMRRRIAIGRPARSRVQDAPHNGQITFSVSLPAPVPSAADECPNKNWKVVVSHVDYLGVVLHIQQNGVDILCDGPHDFHTTP